MIQPARGIAGLDLAGTLRVRPIDRKDPVVVFDDRLTPRELARRILDLRAGLRRALTAARSKTTSSTLPTSVASSSSLGLRLGSTPATLRSTEEVNTTPTSFSPFGPSFAGSSTSLPTVGGVYDGSQGDDTLTFLVTQGGTTGADSITLEVQDGGGQRIDSITFAASDAPGTVKTLANGLTLALGSGSAVLNDSFQVTVSTSTPSAVDPTKPLDGTRNDSPGLESGKNVTPGTFTVNGATITIASGDSLDDVLAKISASAAGVDATFDTATETVVLTQRTVGSAADVTVGSDDTGFLDAVKLAGASSVPGLDDELSVATIASVPALSGISSGTFSINGVTISVDTLNDTLQGVLDRIDGSSAGVAASFDSAGNRVVLTGSQAEDATLDDGTSGFFTATSIATGFHELTESSGETTYEIVDDRFVFARLSDLTHSFNSVFSTEARPDARSLAGAVRSRLRRAIQEAIEPLVDDAEDDVHSLEAGIEIRFDRPEEGVLRLDRRRIEHTSSHDSETLAELLVAREDTSGHDGLLVALDRALDEIVALLAQRLPPEGRAGLVLDVAG